MTVARIQPVGMRTKLGTHWSNHDIIFQNIVALPRDRRRSAS